MRDNAFINLSGSTESIAKFLDDYRVAWRAFIVVHHLDLLESLALPTTVSWKVADKAALFNCLETLGSSATQVHIGTVNSRFIASALLAVPYEGLIIVKILERRPRSTDPLGLDSIDYLVSDMDEIYRLLNDSGAHVKREHNTMHAWLSLRFGKNLEFEAKFVEHLVLDVAIRELQQANKKALKALDQTTK